MPEPLLFANQLPTPAQGRLVFTTRYPTADARVPRDVQTLAFGDVYGVKRVQPGQVLALGDRSFQHDCMTLAGNGGSPVVDLESGLVLGFHFAGRWLESKRGEATSLWRLGEDPLMSNVGVRYADPGGRGA